MFAKLFSRITESSLMEEDIVVRYTFVMMLAISDPEGNVIGTDVAIARRLNMPLGQFSKCIEKLSQPDPDSNSKEYGGRRVLPSEGERGYKLVNYLVYRDMKSTEGRREYMREYMRKHRAAGKQVNANTVNGKQALTHEEGETDSDGEEEPEAVSQAGLAFADWFKTLLPAEIRLSSNWRNQWAKAHDEMIRIDKRAPDEIKAVCAWARADDFWSKNFQSPLKLRHRNKQQTQYFDVFAQAKKSDRKTTTSVKAVTEGRHYGGPTSVPTRRFGSG